MLECGAEPTTPKEPDCLLVTVHEDGIICEPPNPIRRCTPLSVANFALHENSSPIHHVEPGGLLDTADAVFEAVTDRAVRVSRHALDAGRDLHGEAGRRGAGRLPRHHASAPRATRC